MLLQIRGGTVVLIFNAALVGACAGARPVISERRSDVVQAAPWDDWEKGRI